MIQTKTKTVKKPLKGRPLGGAIGAYGEMERKAKAGDPQAKADLALEKSRYKEFADGPGSGPSGGWPTPKKKMGGTVKKKMQMGGKMDKSKSYPAPKPKAMVGMKKAKSGGSFGMLSVKAGIDKNPNPTAADRIAGAKKMAKSGTSMKKCKYGCK
jgi:hypothetical protein